MKTKATEITDAKIDFVSIVDKGANKRPFKILKTSEVAKGTKLSELLGSLTPEVKPEIAVVICAASQADGVAALLKAEGLLSTPEELGELRIFKQTNFDENFEGSIIALNENVVVAFDRVVKGFSGYTYSGDFKENLAAMSFHPGVYAAMDALSSTISNVMYSDDDSDTIKSNIDSALKDFSKHVSGMVKSLPVTLFKMDAAVNQVENEKMNDIMKAFFRGQPAIKETVSGDLAGLGPEPVVVQKQEAQESVVADVVPAVAVVADAEPVVADVVAPVVKQDETETAAPVAAVAAEPAPTEDPMTVVAKTMQAMVDQLVAINDKVSKQSERIDALESAKGQPVAKAAVPQVTTFSIINEQLGALNGNRVVQKQAATASDDAWSGVLPLFDQFVGR